ncbi:MAG: FecR domain-containing protein [Aquamicrobium sp.]|uniref:FecR family protein n=1 Tax=Aquamicrobium sp. TaxID=1872579 RepID=UPI00349EA033|nr:FecR domain-containing protein [Aquamicrobium sp.]
MPPSHKPTEEQREIAALWLAKRTGGSLAPDEQRELEDWLNADPANRLAWDEMRVLWARLEEPAERVAASSPPRGALARQLASPKGWLAAASAGSVAVFAVWLANLNFLEDLQADVVSGHAYMMPVTLPDGSVARMGADTALAYEFDTARRHVRLLRGEAFFEVIPGSAPAFTIDIDGDLVRVVGTRFNVDRADDRTVVVVEEGEVAVKGAHDTAPNHLTPGQQMTVTSGTGGGVEAADLDASLAWMSGRLVVRQVPVSDVVAALGRHTSKRLLVRGEVSGRRISGTFPLDDIDGSLDTIAAAMNATLIRAVPLVTVLF